MSALDGIRQRAEADAGTLCSQDCCEPERDRDRLLGALDAVLTEADDWEKRFQTTNTFDVAMRAAAHKIRAAVNNALEGGTMSNWPPPLASRAIRRHCPHQQVKGGYCAECGTQLNDALEGK